MISSTERNGSRCVSLCQATTLHGYLRLTELFNPFKESPSHFKNSSEGPGAAGLSSFDDVDLTATAAGRAAATAVEGREVFPEDATTADAVGTTFADVVGVTPGRTAVATAAAAAIVATADLPLAPTVVHAPPVGAAGPEGCGTISVSDQRRRTVRHVMLTLVVVSA